LKSAIGCVAAVLLLALPGFAADEKPAASASLVTKATTAKDATRAPVPDAPAPVTATSPAADAAVLPDALPAAPSAIMVLKKRPEAHRFLDTKNSFALSAVAVSLTADALSTQKGLGLPGFYEINPVARPFVQTRGGAAVYSAASMGLVAGGMYVAHRTGHHKLERVLPFAIAGWEGILSARNYHVIATRAK
jgi:hypothetical protein